MPRSYGSLAALLALTLAALGTGAAQGETLLRLDTFEPGKLLVRGFEVHRAGRVDIEAVGVLPRWGDELAAYAWILDTRSR